MNCPKETEDILLDIIYMATLRIQAEAKNGNAHRCGVEAYHIHNLPNILKNYSEDKVLYYYQFEIRSFVTSSEGINIGSFQPLWTKLAALIELKKFDPASKISADPQTDNSPA